MQMRSFPRRGGFARRLSLWVAGGAALLFLATPAALAANKVVTDADNGGEVHLKLGDTLTVRLSANPSTGYMWYILPKSTPLMKLVKQMEAEPGPAERPAAGSGESVRPLGRPILQVFVFEARRPGQGVLLLHYVRSWEKPVADEERFELRVAIE